MLLCVRPQAGEDHPALFWIEHAVPGAPPWNMDATLGARGGGTQQQGAEFCGFGEMGEVLPGETGPARLAQDIG
jgi:hypothetical protein